MGLTAALIFAHALWSDPEVVLKTTCLRCGREAWGNRDTGYVAHVGKDGSFWRGCRAASFDDSKPYGEAWEDIPRGRTAKINWEARQ